MLSSIFRLVRKRDEIIYGYLDGNRDPEEFYLDYDGDNDLCGTRSETFAIDFELELLGSGYYRGVFRLTDKYCIKVQLHSGCTNDSNKKEYKLYKHLKAEKPELSKLLLPVLYSNEYLSVYPICEPLDSTNLVLNNFLVESLYKLFEKNGVLLSDLNYRPDNFGIYDGNLVIIDYADWMFVKDKPQNSLENIKFEYKRGKDGKI